eukprot:COSAG05_NODE_6712_length_916_cov_2.264382_1_plen_45_part_00
MSVADNDTEKMSAIMNKLIADAAEAESQRDAAVAWNTVARSSTG